MDRVGPEQAPNRRSWSEHERYGQYFREHYLDVWHHFRRQGFSVEECQDLAQETFMAGYRGYSDFRGASSFKTWILQIAKNRTKNRFRDNRARRRYAPEVPIEVTLDGGEALVASSEPMPRGDSPLGNALAKERQQKLRAAIEKLPGRMRQCLLMHVYQCLSYRKISTLLGVEIGTVASHINQAKERLGDLLGEFFAQSSGPGDLES